jgi:hypothetical protein
MSWAAMKSASLIRAGCAGRVEMTHPSGRFHRGIEHNDALRRLANRLVGILHGCLKTRTRYDEATAWGHRENTGQSPVAA